MKIDKAMLLLVLLTLWGIQACSRPSNPLPVQNIRHAPIKQPRHTTTNPKKKPTPVKEKTLTTPLVPTKQMKQPVQVDDTNFSPEYMYPQSNTNSTNQTKRQNITSLVSKEKCIRMIGQQRWKHYVELLGTQEAALRRCTLLQAMH